MLQLPTDVEATETGFFGLEELPGDAFEVITGKDGTVGIKVKQTRAEKAAATGGKAVRAQSAPAATAVPKVASKPKKIVETITEDAAMAPDSDHEAAADGGEVEELADAPAAAGPDKKKKKKKQKKRKLIVLESIEAHESESDGEVAAGPWSELMLHPLLGRAIRKVHPIPPSSKSCTTNTTYIQPVLKYVG